MDFSSDGSPGLWLELGIWIKYVHHYISIDFLVANFSKIQGQLSVFPKLITTRFSSVRLRPASVEHKSKQLAGQNVGYLLTPQRAVSFW